MKQRARTKLIKQRRLETFRTQRPPPPSTQMADHDKSLEEIALDAKPTASDGKQVWTLEDYLGTRLKHPTGADTMRMNCASILRMLNIPFNGAGDKLLKRAAIWLRANGYRAVQRGKTFAVALVHAQVCPHHIV